METPPGVPNRDDGAARRCTTVWTALPMKGEYAGKATSHLWAERDSSQQLPLSRGRQVAPSTSSAKTGTSSSRTARRRSGHAVGCCSSLRLGDRRERRAEVPPRPVRHRPRPPRPRPTFSCPGRRLSTRHRATSRLVPPATTCSQSPAVARVGERTRLSDDGAAPCAARFTSSRLGRRKLKKRR